jgi:drug/metabolite transporter (DMT)-like permease
VTVFLALSPVTAALLGVGLLGEALTSAIVLGMLCVAGGLWMATRSASG